MNKKTTKKFTYCMPTKIVYGLESLNDVDNFIDGRKTLLVTSKGFKERGLIEKLTSLSDDIVSIISNVKPHPDFKDLKLIYKKIDNIDFELILAIGGGSVIDTAKFISVQRGDKQKDYKFVENLTKNKLSKKNYNLVPVIAIPTTAGTGSEITPWATVWDKSEKKKYSLHLPDLFPLIAIYDPSLTLSVSKEITIQTGLDTLSHALESIWNKNASLITVDYAIKSAKLIVEYLPRLVDDLDNIDYRDKIMKACMYAGLSFSNTQTAIAHGMSYYITAHKNIPHGIACSFTLPMLIDNIIGKYDYIDDALVEIFGELSSNELRNIFKELNISTEFSDYGVSEDELKDLKLSLQGNQRAGNSLVGI